MHIIGHIFHKISFPYDILSNQKKTEMVYCHLRVWAILVHHLQ